MEQKKTLWIIAAVGVFLLVVLGGALIVCAPGKKAASSAKTVSKLAGNEGWTQLPDPQLKAPEASKPLPHQEGFVSAQTTDMVVLSDNTKVYGFNTDSYAQVQNQLQNPATAQTQSQTFDLNSLKNDIAASQPNNQNINITVNIPDTTPKTSDSYVTVQSPVSVNSEYYVQEVQSKNVTKSNVTNKSDKLVPPATSATPKTTGTETKSVTTTSTKSASSSVTAKSNTTVTVAAPKTVTRYWVQVVSYTNKNTAENARSVLGEKKISSDIYTYQDPSNKLYYRVRVGPFTTKSEAEYWKAKILEIKEFSSAGSYVTSTND